MRSANTFTLLLLILLSAIALQLPVIHDMATHLLKQDLPIIHSIRSLLSRHKVVSSPTTLLASNQRSSSTPTTDHKRFSSSSTTMADTVVVLKKEHVKLWEAIMEVYKAMLPEDKYNGAKERFDMFKAAYGTVSLILFLDPPVQRSSLTAFCSRYSFMKTPPTCVSFKRSSKPTKTSSHNVSALHALNLASVISPANIS